MQQVWKLFFNQYNALVVHYNIFFLVGHTSTHAVVYARLITQGVDHGVHPFIVQLRSLEDHSPLPGKFWVIFISNS